MTIIETTHLTLQEAHLGDAQFFFELLNSPNWIESIGDRGVETMEDAEIYIQKALIDSYRENGFGLYKMVIKKEEKPIGICGLVKRANLDNVDIGFAILPAFEGKGYTYEAALATLDHAHHKLGLTRICAITTPSNLKTQKLLTKLGLKHVDMVTIDPDDPKFLLYTTQYKTP